MTALTGWTLPQTPSGRSSLLVEPPWHYSGDLFVVESTVDQGVAASFMPSGVEADPAGAASLVFADWCSASDQDERVGRDPAVGQYHEAFWVLHGSYDGRPAGRIPFIYVDSELSLVRGHVQGYPKKLADIAMSRAVTVGRGGPRKEPGGQFTGHVSRLGHRLFEVRVVLEEATEDFPAGLALPHVHTRLFPSVDPGAGPAVEELAFVTATGVEVGDRLVGSAELVVGDSPLDEVALLRPTSVGRGFVLSFAFSVVGGTTAPIGGTR